MYNYILFNFTINKFLKKKRNKEDELFNRIYEKNQKYIYYLYNLSYQLNNQIVIRRQTINQLEIKKQILSNEIDILKYSMLSKENEDHKCKICFENNINCAIVPCVPFCNKC